MAHIIEKATNQLLRELHENLEDQLAAGDAEMQSEDEDVAELLGWQYGPILTPTPALWQIGQTLDFTQLNVGNYPVVACWGHDIIPDPNQNGNWGTANGRMLIMVTVLAEDTIYLSRFAYRYVDAIHRIIKNTTLAGLCEPINTVPRVNMAAPLQREHDDQTNPYWLQPVAINFIVQYVEV